MTSSTFLITGAGGMLGSTLERVLQSSGRQVVGLKRADLDVTKETDVRAVLVQFKPSVVIQCAAYTKVDDAEREEETATAINAFGAALVAGVCAEVGARFVYPSTDYVFDGTAAHPYPPEAAPRPVNAYGRSKLKGEQMVAGVADALIVRTSWLYGAGGRNFVRTVANNVLAGQPMRVVSDQRGALTWTLDLARALIALVDAHAPAGIYHFANAGVTTWYEVAQEVAQLLGVRAVVEPCATADYPIPTNRPAYSVLDCSKTDSLIGPARPWREALNEAVKVSAY